MELVWKCCHICFQVLRLLRLIYVKILFKFVAEKMENVWERFHNDQHYKAGHLFCQKNCDGLTDGKKNGIGDRFGG